ncbi:MAG: WD40 repeat domain-containing protein [Planctomycetota bacterium]|jgi:hypothetical protein
MCRRFVVGCLASALAAVLFLPAGHADESAQEARWRASDATSYPEAYRTGTNGVLALAGARCSEGWENGGVEVVAWGKNGTWIATAHFGGPVRLWAAESEKPFCSFEQRHGATSLTASLNGRWLAVAWGMRGDLEVFDVRREQRLHALRLEGGTQQDLTPPGGHAVPVTEQEFIGFRSDGKLLASMRVNRFAEGAGILVVDLWTVRTGEFLRSVFGPWGSRPVLGPKFKVGLTVFSEGTVAIVDLKTGKTLRTFDGGLPFAFSPKGDWAVVGVEGAFFQSPGGGPADGESSVATYVDGSAATIRRVKDGEALRALARGPAVLSTFGVSPDGVWIAALGRSLAGEHGKAGSIGEGEDRVEFTAVGPQRLWLWETKTGELVDDIAIPCAGRLGPMRDSIGGLHVGDQQVRLVSDEDLLTYDITR